MHSVPWSLVGAVAAICAAIFILALTVLATLVRSGKERDLTGRIAHYGPRRQLKPVDESADSKQTLNRAALDVTKRMMSPQTQQQLAERLDLAAAGRTPAEWTLLGCGLGIVVAAALSLATGYVLVGVPLGALIAWLVMRMWLSFKIRRRRAAFADQLPDMLQLITSALKSGFSLQQAVDAVVRDNAQPAAGEFARALTEAKLGADLDDCLDMVATRMDSADLRWTVMAIRIQRSIGGNLAEVLATIFGTIRERSFLRRQVRALSAEGRLSAYILVALPVVMGGYLFLVNRKYMRPLYTTPGGLAALVVAVLLLIIGAFWMRKTVQLEV